MTQRLILTNVNMFDGSSDVIRKGCAIVVENGIIADILEGNSGESLENGKKIDLSGYTLTPGFIDCHMHMLIEEVGDKEHSLTTSSPGGERLYTADAAVAYLGAYNCRRMLDAGFTTVVDGGGCNFIECVLKEAIKKGYVEGPDLYIAGKQITTTKAHFPGFSMEPCGPWGMRKAVRDLTYYSVDHVKLQLSPPIRMVGRNSEACDFTPEEIEAAIDEAHNYGLPVHAHLRGAEAVKRFLRAGGDLVVHGTGMDDEGIELMLQKDRYLLETLLSPTPYPPEKLVAAKRQETIDLLARTADRHWKSVKKAYEAGVKIAFSTDAGTLGIDIGTNAEEFMNLQKIGMSPAEALRSATSVAADAIGHGDTVGRIKKGYRANFAVLDGDPLEDLTATKRAVMTFKDGRIVADHRDTE
ncbi:MAG: amidohydrolase family protein [Lachnospiraceae bacterium]|nr:amidohydrolase family protein [Lachnospiraceae bacterium]